MGYKKDTNQRNMNRIQYLIIIVIVLFGSQNKNYSQNYIHNETIEIEQDTLFDVEKGQLIITKDDSTWIETYEREIPKKRIIFKKGKVYHYKAIYIGSNNDTLSNSFVNIRTTGLRWDQQPEMQDLIYYEFPGYKADSIRLSNHNINKKHQDWTDKRGTGVIENVERVWMHPIRVNQYKFTEVAPFPEVFFPLQKGKKWDGGETSIFEGWDEWSGQTVKSKYKISGKATYLLKKGSEISCWVIKSVAKCSSGKSKLLALFNEEYGFVKMEYQNYENEKLVFELIDVEEK